MKRLCSAILAVSLLIVPPTLAQDADPNVRITAPEPDSMLTGEVMVAGTANLPAMSGYYLEVRPLPDDPGIVDPDAVWLPIMAGIATPVQDGPLGIWNTLGVADGLYELRLTVSRMDGPPVHYVVSPLRVANEEPAAPEADAAAEEIAEEEIVEAAEIVAEAPVPAPAVNVTEQIAFMSERDGNWDIYVMDTGGGNLRNLTNHPANEGDPCWSPDGTRIVFNSSRDGNREIYIMDADGANPRRLTTNSADDWWPVWSPDGAQIAFMSHRDGNHEIYAINADGTGLRNVTANAAEDSSPSWSPDGTEIVFSSDRDGNYELYVMNAAGTNVRRLTDEPAGDFNPAWSPDGAQIAFMSERDGNREIYIMDADGTNVRRLTDHANADLWPGWSPDGNQIVFTSDRDGNYEVYAINADGTGTRRLTDNPGGDLFATWQSVSVSLAAAPVPTAGDKTCTMTTLLGDNNLRAGPGTEYEMVGKIGGSETFDADGIAKDTNGYTWWRLSTGAWIRGDLVTWSADICWLLPEVEP